MFFDDSTTQEKFTITASQHLMKTHPQYGCIAIDDTVYVYGISVLSSQAQCLDMFYDFYRAPCFMVTMLRGGGTIASKGLHDIGRHYYFGDNLNSNLGRIVIPWHGNSIVE